MKLPYGLEALLICKTCAHSADGDVCPACEKPITLTVAGTFREHKAYKGGPRCQMAGWAPQAGHTLCKGCDCKHGPAGSLVSVPPLG